MKRYTILFLLFFVTTTVYTQGLIEAPLPGIDSLKNIQLSRPESGLSIPDFSPGFPILLLSGPLTISTPAFDINKYLQSNWKIDYQSFDYLQPGNYTFHGRPFLVSPLFHSGTIFNQASYQLNDKLTFGGNSFGVNSIFTAPLPHPSANQWENRGASMFMQYKVNRNFKIETRISVTGNQFHP
jgi:hypothetical protein